jgi:serine/threonine protein kinase
MGVVYKARQDKANRLVALKMILSGAHAGDAERLRFQAEAQAVASLSHPHIVQVYEVSETPEGHCYFSLEYVAGGTRAERLRNGPLPADAAADLLEALARAIQTAHEHGIIHRDLKPQNILLRDEGRGMRDERRETRGEEFGTILLRDEGPGARGEKSGARLGTRDEKETIQASAPRLASASDATLAAHPSSPVPGPLPLTSPSSLTPRPSSLFPKISDFGLAKRLDSEDGLTHTGAIMGTPSYMAPEQALGQSKNVGPAADIYALGVVLYECLAGRPPFKGTTLAETLDQVCTMEPVPPGRLTKNVPRDLETICLHCLRKEPERRYASAELLAEDLRRFRAGLPLSVRPVGTVERVGRWCRRNPKWAAMIATVVLLLCGVTGVSVYAYFTVAAMNEDIQAKNKAITKEAAEKEEQRKLAIKEAAEKEKQRLLAIKEAGEKETQRLLAEKRLLQSIDAVSLFARDARIFCEDAMVPAASRQKLYEVLINQLEKNVDDKEWSIRRRQSSKQDLDVPADRPGQCRPGRRGTAQEGPGMG